MVLFILVDARFFLWVSGRQEMFTGTKVFGTGSGYAIWKGQWMRMGKNYSILNASRFAKQLFFVGQSSRSKSSNFTFINVCGQAIATTSTKKMEC